MRFPLMFGLAASVALPLPLPAAEIVPPPRHLLGIPLVRELGDLFCPAEHRLEVVIASLRRAGWRREGPQTNGPVVQRHPSILTPWQLREQVVWVRQQGMACVISPAKP